MISTIIRQHLCLRFTLCSNDLGVIRLRIQSNSRHTFDAPVEAQGSFSNLISLSQRIWIPPEICVQEPLWSLWSAKVRCRLPTTTTTTTPTAPAQAMETTTTITAPPPKLLWQGLNVSFKYHGSKCWSNFQVSTTSTWSGSTFSSMLVRTRQFSWQSDLINLQLEPLQNYLLLTSTPCLLGTNYSSKALNLAIGNWILLLSFMFVCLFSQTSLMATIISLNLFL